MLFIFLSGHWLGRAIGAVNPTAAAEFFKETSVYTGNAVSAANPFDNFLFESGTATQPDADISTMQSYHPLYNVHEEYMASEVSDIVLKKDSCYVKNLTHHSARWVKEHMLAPLNFTVKKIRPSHRFLFITPMLLKVMCLQPIWLMMGPMPSAVLTPVRIWYL